MYEIREFNPDKYWQGGLLMNLSSFALARHNEAGRIETDRRISNLTGTDHLGATVVLPWLSSQLDGFTFTASAASQFFSEISGSQRAALQEKFGSQGLSTLEHLCRERNGLLLYTDLYHLARSLETQGHLNGAASIYRLLSESSEGANVVPESLTTRATERLALLNGEASLGESVEFYGPQIMAGITDGPTLFAFGVAGASFRVGRLATARLLMNHGPRALAGSGLGLRIGSGLGGFLLEGSVFPMSHLGAEQVLGRPVDWSAAHLEQATLSSYLVLGGLRAGGVVGRSAFLWARQNRSLLQAVSGSVAFSRSAPALIPLTTQYGGVLLGQWGQERFGLAPEQNLSQHMVAGLVTLIQMQGMGAIHHGLTRNSLGRLERSLDRQTETLIRHPSLRPPMLHPWNPTLAWGWAGAGRGEIGFKTRAPDPRLENHVFNMGQDGKGDRKGPTETVPGVRWGSSNVERGNSQEAIYDPLRDERAAAFLLETDPARFEQGLRNFVNSQELPVAVAWVSLAEGLGKIFVVNERFSQKFGFNSEQISQLRLADIFSAKDKLRVLPLIPLRIRSGYFEPMAMKIRHSNGSWVPVIGSGVYRRVFDKNLAFGFFRDPPAGNSEGIVEAPMVEMLRGSRDASKVRPDAEGIVELNSLVELNLQMAQGDSALVARLRNQDLQLRIMGFASQGILQRQKEPWLRFLNAQDRREPFASGRRLQIEVPATDTRGAESLILFRGIDGFHELGRFPQRNEPQGSGTLPDTATASLFPSANLAGETGRSSESGVRKPRMKPSGTLARVTAALDGREIPAGPEGTEGELMQQLTQLRLSIQESVGSQSHWGGNEVQLNLNTGLDAATLKKHAPHLVSYLNHLTGTVEIPIGLPVVLEVHTLDGVESFRLVRGLGGFRFET